MWDLHLCILKSFNFEVLKLEVVLKFSTTSQFCAILTLVAERGSNDVQVESTSVLSKVMSKVYTVV